MTTTTPDTDTTALADLDADLEQDVPCMALIGCDQPAAHRATAVHVTDGTVCWTFLLCDPHTALQKQQVARAWAASCVEHARLVNLRWQPLRPGRSRLP